MPRNAIAMMYPWSNSLPYLDFHIRKDPKNVNSGFFTPNETDSWFWPISGVSYQDKIYLFAYYVYNNGTGPFGFAFHGTAVITVTNVTANPDQWEYSYYQIPGTDNNLLWGTAALLEDTYVFLLGTNSGSTILSRIRVEYLQLGNWSKLEKWSKLPNSPNPFWNIEGTPVSIFEAIPETTLQYNQLLQKYFVLNIKFMTSQILITWADHVTGPWSDWEVIYNIPAPWNDSTNAFCYAPKSHPELTTKTNEIILTFASNAFKLDYLLDHLQIYDPQIIRVLVNT